MSVTNMRQLRVCSELADEFEERSFDTDIVLPDYCPDVAVVLKCIVRPMITSHFQSGDRYTVDGVIAMRILYLTEDRDDVYCYETSQTFTVPFRCVDAIHHHVDVKTDYVNCRATGPRRLDIHGAIRVFLKTVGISEKTVWDNAACRNDMHSRCQKIGMTVPVCEVNKSFYVNDTIDFGVKANRHLYADITVAGVEQKKLKNKLIVKGVLLVKDMYKTDQHTDCLKQEIPFSQIIDIENLAEDWIVNTAVSVGETENYLQETENGGSRMSVNCKLTAHICCGRYSEDEVALDVYSTEHPVLCESESINFMKQEEANTSTTVLEDVTELPDGIVDIVDLWGEVKDHKLDQDDNGRRLSCCLLLGIIGRDDSGHMGYYERTMDCCVPCDAYEYPTRIRVLSIDHAIANNQLRFKATIERIDEGVATQAFPVVTRVIEETSSPYTKNGACVRLIYPEGGELLWDIAKKHHSSVKKIQEENDIDSDRVQDAMMLIVPIA